MQETLWETGFGHHKPQQAAVFDPTTTNLNSQHHSQFLLIRYHQNYLTVAPFFTSVVLFIHR